MTAQPLHQELQGPRPRLRARQIQWRDLSDKARWCDRQWPGTERATPGRSPLGRAVGGPWWLSNEMTNRKENNVKKTTKNTSRNGNSMRALSVEELAQVAGGITAKMPPSVYGDATFGDMRLIPRTPLMSK